MPKKLPFLSIIVFVIVTSCFVTSLITYVETDKFWTNEVDRLLSSEESETTKDLSELIKLVDDKYVYSFDTASLSEGVLSGFVNSLPDRYSMYMDREEYQNFISFQNSPSSLGIGVSTIYDSTREGLYVVSVYKGSPAEQSGIVPGDVITHIDEKFVGNLGYYTSMHAIANGRENQKIKLFVKKLDGHSDVLNISRAFVGSEGVTGEKAGDKIGIIRISRFSVGDENTFKQSLEKLIMSGHEKFVIDLRNNPGGDIETASRILDFLLPEGPVFTVTDKSGATNTFTSDTSAIPYPLAVIINENTVCEAEVFAKALSNFGTARIFGTNSYGKTSTQSVYPLSNGGAASISSVKYALVGSEDFGGVGITPDVTVALSDEIKAKYTTMTKEEDAPLQAALEYLRTAKLPELYD